MRKKVFFLFLDGVGLGDDSPSINPLAATFMPNLESLLGGQKLVASGHPQGKERRILESKRLTLLSLDACMGVEGLPQSATGQAALLTGKNVPAWLGEHEGPKPTGPIIELLRRGTLFTKLGHQGKSVDFLNAYPPRYFEAIARDYHLPGVIALSARLAGLQLKTWNDLLSGRAVSADFTGEGWRSFLGFSDAPVLSYAQAGEQLHALSKQVDLAMFEYWLTDVAGHHQDLKEASTVLQALDRVIGSLASLWDDDNGLILLTSDHGNLEDLSTRHHTLNAVPLLLIGSQKLREDFLRGLNSACRTKPDLTAITPAILKFLD
jgi:2,3-bisphosphoglycerate-independent phosphoglycerate mutase